MNYGPWIDYGESLYTFIFVDELMQVGAQLDFGGLEVRLAGDMNQQGGICDCCPHPDQHRPIVRYRLPSKEA